jgi:HSP20 family protein
MLPSALPKLGVVNRQVPVAVAGPVLDLKADVYEAPGADGYVIEIPLPGIKPEELTIEVTVETVTVSANPRPPDDPVRRFLLRELGVQPTSRIFEFPMRLDTDNVRATLENGILKIRAPTAEAGRRRVIRVGQAA